MKSTLLCLSASAVIALTSLEASSATIDETIDYSNIATGTTFTSNIGSGTTTFTGTIDPSLGSGYDEDYFSFTATAEINSIVIDSYILDPVPDPNVTAFQVFTGLNANFALMSEATYSSVTNQLLLSGPLAAGDYTIYIRETNGSGTNPYEISVNAVPLPAAAWLFISGLCGLVMIKRKR